MRRRWVVSMALALAAAAQAQGRGPFSIPAWLQPYPGAQEEIKSSRGMVVATYETGLSLDEMLAFHRGLFAAQKVPFHPEIYGMTALIRANVEGCGLTVQIRQAKSGTSVQITASERPIIPKVTEADVRHSMEKYDQPVYNPPRKPQPALDWPDWLASYRADASPIREGVDRFKNRYMESEFDSTEERGSIQAYYSGLLDANGYRVTAESSPITPRQAPALVEGTHAFERSGRFVIRIDLTPTAKGIHVTMRITAHPV